VALGSQAGERPRAGALGWLAGDAAGRAEASDD
jgi:hypothetical protein